MAPEQRGTRQAQIEEEPGPDRGLTFVAFLLLITAAWLPWWVVTWKDEAGQVYDRVSVGLFQDGGAAAHQAATMVTGVLLLGTIVLLFVRLAARSWVHEPTSWRRDITIALFLQAAALASALFWPQGVPSFWGGRTFGLEDAEGTFTETALPGLGWWLALLACLLQAVAVYGARKRAVQAGSGAEASGANTPK